MIPHIRPAAFITSVCIITAVLLVMEGTWNQAHAQQRGGILQRGLRRDTRGMEGDGWTAPGGGIPPRANPPQFPGRQTPFDAGIGPEEPPRRGLFRNLRQDIQERERARQNMELENAARENPRAARVNEREENPLKSLYGRKPEARPRVRNPRVPVPPMESEMGQRKIPFVPVPESEARDTRKLSEMTGEEIGNLMGD